MNTARCPSCRSDVIVEDESYEGDIFDCSNCGAQSELTALHPPQLRLLENDEEAGLDPEYRIEDDEEEEGAEAESDLDEDGF